MGQYFKAVNLDKEEVVCPWCLHGGAKLWEWAANPQGAIFTLLLRKSSASGGGDYGSRPTQVLSITDSAKTLAEVVAEGVGLEGRPILLPEDTVVGRWAGDRVVLVGDYDESKLWDTSKTFRNISKELVDAWNGFIDIPQMRLTYNPTCSCQKDSD